MMKMAKLEKDQEKVITQGKSGADLVVDSLINQGVTHVFGIPGAKSVSDCFWNTFGVNYFFAVFCNRTEKCCIIH